MCKKLNLALLPDDILLNILELVNLADVLAFPLVCCAFSVLAQNRALWINALNAERLLRPIACPDNTNLVTLALEELRRVACHTHHLQCTWAIDNPAALHISGPVKVVLLDTRMLDLLGPVWGTEYYLFFSRASGELVVWDASVAQTVGALYVAPRILDAFPGRQTEGESWLGLLVSDSESCDKLLIVCLDFAGGHATLTITFEYSFKPNFTHRDMFMTKEYIGAIEYAEQTGESTNSQTNDYIRIAAVNIETAQYSVIITDIPEGDIGTFDLCTIKDNVFIFFDNELTTTSQVFLVPKTLLPHDTNVPDTSTLICRMDAPSVTWDAGCIYEPDCVLSCNDTHWGPAVSLKRRVGEQGRSCLGMHARFWEPKPLPLEGLTEAAGGLSFVIVPKWNVEISGILQYSPDGEWLLASLSSSGHMAILVVEDDTGLKLHLIVVDRELDRCVVHRLAVPSFINLASVCTPLIDECRGVVSLHTQEGMLFIIPFARNLQILE